VSPTQQQILTCCDSSGPFCVTGYNGFEGSGCHLSLWDSRKFSGPICDFKGHNGTVTGCKFLCNSQDKFVSSSNDGSIRLWMKTQERSLDAKNLQSGQLASITSYFDSNILLSISFNEGLKMLRIIDDVIT